MSDLSFDVAVMGAGPAGSAAAREARALGLSVALIDRAVFPRQKLCGALVSPRAAKAVDRIFGMAMPHDMYLSSREVAFKWDGDEIRRVTAPYDLTYTYRLDFDDWLRRAAVEAGAEDMQGTRVDTIQDMDQTLVLADGRTLRYGVLIGADGAASPVAKHILGAAYDPDKIGFAFETEAPGGCDAGAPMSIDFDIVRWGYGWNFPKRDSRTIGLGAIRSVDQDLKDLMARYLAHEGVDPGAVAIKGAHIPLGDFKEKPGRGNVLLAGDAAGFVDAITGEGIALALESGAEAARAAQQVIAEGRPNRADRAYFKRIKYIQSDLEKVRKLRVIAYSSAMRELFKDKLATSDMMSSSLFAVLAGEATYADVEKRVAKRAFMSAARGLSSWPAKLVGRSG